MAQNEYAAGRALKLPVPAGVASGGAILIGGTLPGVAMNVADGVQVTAAPAAPAAPDLTHSATATSLLAGVYTAAQSYINEAGETLPGATATVTILAGDKITVAALAFPVNVRGRKIYLSQAHDDPTLKLAVTDRTGAAVDLTAVGNGAVPPAASTAGALQSAPVEIGGYVITLPVKGIDNSGNNAVAVGDRLYLDPQATPPVSKNATLGVLCGKALGTVSGGATATIPVLLVQA